MDTKAARYFLYQNREKGRVCEKWKALVIPFFCKKYKNSFTDFMLIEFKAFKELDFQEENS